MLNRGGGVGGRKFIFLSYILERTGGVRWVRPQLNPRLFFINIILNWVYVMCIVAIVIWVLMRVLGIMINLFTFIYERTYPKKNHHISYCIVKRCRYYSIHNRSYHQAPKLTLQYFACTATRPSGKTHRSTILTASFRKTWS